MSNFRETVTNYRPTKKALFWSCAGTAVLTMVIGFSWGGWVTGGTATEMAEAQSEQATASLAASICVERYLAAPDARTSLAALKEESSFSRDDMVADAGWTTFGGSEDPVDGAAEMCADQLAEMELPSAPEPVAIEADAAPAQQPAGTDSATTPETDGTAS